MQYLKTSTKQSQAGQPAPDFNCGWSALNLLSSWCIQESVSRKRAQAANQDGRQALLETGESNASTSLQHRYS
ncbi:hypothetical protein [Rhizobium sp. CF142]|uniref:hypothetical protein n=1 Tax=Rhizobium sp. CF142 TaxID=1144314 RepID=UPI00026F0097|nr:hypothetical protein [Rhizobium sp. CF142]EJJ29278.1 hypothetical protein PMI11_02460 [Rhizobium sp. CF142]